MEKNYFTILRSTNIILRARKIKSGYSLMLDIHFRGKRYIESLNIILSTIDKRKFTKEDSDLLNIAKKIHAKRVLEIADDKYLANSIFNQNSSVLKYYEALKDERKVNKDKSWYKWSSSYNHFGNYLKKKSISFKEVDRRFLEGYKSFLMNTISQNTARTYFSILSEVFEKARKDRIIQFNPMSDINGIKLAGTTKTFLTEEELKKVIYADVMGISVVSKKAFIFACLTGIRFDDIRKLTGESIKFENGYYYLYFISSKSKKSDRVMLHESAVEQIEKTGNGDLLFPGLVTKKRINIHIRKLIQSAGIDKHITFHCAKHTFATMALNSGVDVYTLKELLHHSDIRTTEIYARLLSKAKDEAINKLPKF